MVAQKLSAWTRARFQSVISWVAVMVGWFVGFFACALLGMAPPSDSFSTWYLRWLGITGFALLGLGFLVGSCLALRNRRSAGIVFLLVMPVAAFCLAYPASGFLVWRDGSGWFETPLPTVAIGLTALFYGPFLAPLLMWRRKKRAAIAFGSGA